MGIFGTESDERNAYRTYEGIVGRSLRRGTDKAIYALTLGMVGGSDPLETLAKDAAKEAVTKAIPRSQEKR